MGVVLVDDAGKPLAAAVEAYPCNRDAEALFMRFQTQWIRNGFTGAPMGLNYPGIESGARLAGLTISPEQFDDLQTIERGALGHVLNIPEFEHIDVIRVGFEDIDE